MGKEELKPGVKDLLVFLVKQEILPKEAVQQCKDRKQDALRKGYSITVKEILIEQGYITDETEYNTLWKEMEEDFRIHNKLAGPPDMANFTLTENLLEELITEKEINRDRYPQVPTDVIEAVTYRWKEPQVRRPQPFKGSRLAQLSRRIRQTTVVVGSITRRLSKKTAKFMLYSLLYNTDMVLTILAGITMLWVLISANHKFTIPPPVKYSVQKLDMEIPDNPKTQEKILEGKTETLEVKYLPAMPPSRSRN